MITAEVMRLTPGCLRQSVYPVPLTTRPHPKNVRTGG